MKNLNGIIIVNKPKSVTSRDVVNEISKIVKTKKVGHTGTLDPLATGVLVICVGSATKLTSILTAEEKEYIAEIVLGLETDTLDCTGIIKKEEDTTSITETEIDNALKSMIKTYQQEVPIYSAVKVKGKKLYEYARRQEEVTLPKKEVTIQKIERTSPIRKEQGKTIFWIKCQVSKGTYIRSLIRDIAQKLHTVGIMNNLTRTKQGPYTIQESHTIEALKEKYEIIPLTKVLKEYKQVIVNNQEEQEIKNGKILENKYQASEIVFLNQHQVVLALYHTYDKDPSKIKPWKML